MQILIIIAGIFLVPFLLYVIPVLIYSNLKNVVSTDNVHKGILTVLIPFLVILAYLLIIYMFFSFNLRLLE